MSMLTALGRRPMEDFQGLHIGCAPGTHAALVEMIKRHVTPGPGILDIGTQTGALLARLNAAGFTEMTGVDLDSTRFNFPQAEFRRTDLNQNFSEDFDQKFNLIVSTDVIEHLDSPRHFMTQAWEMLNDGGYLGLTFPNVAFWEGRCKFMLKGELWGFGESNYRRQRHISPMTLDLTRMMAMEVGFEPVEAGSGGGFATPLRQAILAPIWLPLRWVGGRLALGESLVVLLRKAQPDPDLKAPVHYRDRWQGIPDDIGLDD